MKKLGLDMGSSSLGWVITENGKIVKKGVVTFDTGMVKDQSGGYVSPTRERREVRSKRNLIRARKYRKWELLEVLVENDLVPLGIGELEMWSKYKKGQTRKFPENEQFLQWLACNFTYDEGVNYKHPYELRVKALDQKLSKYEFGRALYHLVQRRGYKDIGETDRETEKQIARRDESGFQKALDENRTIAEALVKEFLNNNERARNQYPYRDEYHNELELICKGQGYDISKDEEGNYNNKFVAELWKTIIWQRPLKSQKGNIGKCTLEPKKLRCSLSHPIFEIFRTWQFINTIKFYDEDGNKQSLEQKHRNELFEWFLKKDSNFKFEEIKTFLNKKFEKPKRYNYPISKDKNGKEIYDTSVAGMPVCKNLIDIFGDDVRQALATIENYNKGNVSEKGGGGNAPKIIKNYSAYDLWHAIFNFDEKFLEKFAVEKLGIENVTRKRKGEDVSISPLVELKSRFLQGYADLSLKAMCKIIPFLKQGYLYNEAVILAKMPELLGENWEMQKEIIIKAAKEANNIYEWNKTINEIVNKLIDKYKGLSDSEQFAFKNFEYQLDNDDVIDIIKTCESKFGEKSWTKREDKDEIINAVKDKYQEFFKDETRSYSNLKTLTDTFDELLRVLEINIDADELYHHSNLENKYLKKCKTNNGTEKPELPKARNKNGFEVDILPAAIIDSIKNPMFNKSMSILRKLINELIKDDTIDNETEVVIELARELNDNNKRIAIERYQNERKNNREKYREFLKEYSVKENCNINIEKSIPTFELWTEQTFAETIDDIGNKIINKDRQEILREKNALKRYELWLEQKGQCIYTGRMIGITTLFSTAIDIMHTIPRSLLPDDTMANITVGYASYNRDLQKQKLPKECANYNKDVEGWGTNMIPRLKNWEEIRDRYKKQYEDRLKAKGNEDENTKNKRIQEKHYFKLHYDYWKDKLERFEADEVTDKWARRQLTDTQMVGKYAREFLKTYFMKVSVQKGTVTAAFRKIFGFQEEDEIKSRNKHTHHAIDALVLTLIPNNSSHRERILKEYYKAIEEDKKEGIKALKSSELMQKLNVQKFITEIENSTLIFNYKKNKVLKQTAKTVRKRGKKQYLKDRKGKFALNENGDKILLKAKGDTVRSGLYAQTYLGKIREVERDNFEKEINVEKLNLKIKVIGLPIKRRNNDWAYKQGRDEFSYVKRDDINKIKVSEALINNIVDPCIRELVRKQKNNAEIIDSQGNVIRHVRIKVNAGKEVKERINYRSKHEYKNKFYSESGSIPYAVFLQKPVSNGIERKMIPVASYEIAKMYKKTGKFDIEQYIQENYADFASWNKTLLKVGQKVLVLKEDSEYESRGNIDFQMNRLYIITQFKYDGSKILLQYHLEAQSKNDIDKNIKSIKDGIVKEKEVELGIPLIKEDENISNLVDRKKDYQKRVEDFTTRLKIISIHSSSEIANTIKMNIEQYKTESSVITIEGQTPILGLSKKNWNFLLEGVDFVMCFDGTIIFDNLNSIK
jgi:CRISPR-associated endonuclease Csn1